jgi:hypothetical protein
VTASLHCAEGRVRRRHARASGAPLAGPRLHLRYRGVPAFVVGVAVVALLAWLAADWLVHRDWLGGAEARIPVVAAAPLLAAVLASSGLGGADEELERTTAVPWRLIRALHVLGAFVLVGGVLAVTALWESRTYGAHELVRNAAGYVGMVAAASVVTGTRLAWAPAFGYAAVVYLAAPKPLRPETAWWTWPLQPWNASPAAWAAALLFVAGIILYAHFGPRALPYPEPA